MTFGAGKSFPLKYANRSIRPDSDFGSTLRKVKS